MDVLRHTTRLGGLELPTWLLVAAGVGVLLGGSAAVRTVQRRMDEAQPVPRSGRYFWPINPMKASSPDVAFLDPGYPARYGLHTGVDLNGPNGRDTDLGQPVHAITDGRVIAVLRDVAESWGNLVIVHHPGPAVWARYAHLQRVTVREGQVVSAGQQIGTVGKGYRGRWDAHLHLDIIKVRLEDWTDWPMHDRARLLATYADPWEFLQAQERAGRMSRPPAWSRDV